MEALLHSPRNCSWTQVNTHVQLSSSARIHPHYRPHMYTHSEQLTIMCLHLYSKQAHTKIPKLSRRTHSKEDVYTGRLTRQEVSLVHISFTSPYRWLCLEDSRPRRQRLGLVGTGSPKSTIDFSLSLSTKTGSSEDTLGQGWSTLSAVLHAGSREPAVCGKQRLQKTRVR